MNWASQRVIVTGGAGFLGSHVVERLLQAGCERPFIVRSRNYDLTREEQVVRLFAEHPADIVIHLAGVDGGNHPDKQRPAQVYYRNLAMGALVLHHAWKSGVKKVVCSGAGRAYPEHAPLPLKEENYWDGFPQQSGYAYGLAKRSLHAQAMAYWDENRFPVIVALLGNLYGPHDSFDLDRAHVIPRLVRKFVEATELDWGVGKTVTVCGSGEPRRDFLYAADAAEGMLQALETYDRAELVNLASGVEYSIREVVDTLVALTGFEGRVRWEAAVPEGQSHRLFDISKAQRDLGFTPATSLTEGLGRTIEWFREARPRNLPITTVN